MRLAAAALAFVAGLAQAAGGHFDVDDATVLAAGHCQVEVWALRASGSGAGFEHLGPACRLGAEEWGLNLDRARSGATGGLQFKWVSDPAAARISAGVVLGLARQGGARPSTLSTAYVPVTFWVAGADALQVHLNAGIDHDSHEGRWRRWGVAAEWAPGDDWSAIVERRSLLGQALQRFGARFSFGPALSLDASLARSRGLRQWALGLNREWD